MIGTITNYAPVFFDLAELSSCHELPPEEPRPNHDTWLAWRAKQAAVVTPTPRKKVKRCVICNRTIYGRQRRYCFDCAECVETARHRAYRRNYDQNRKSREL